MKKNYRYSLNKKPKSKQGRFTVITALISAVVFVFSAFISAIFLGKGPAFVGAAGLAAMLISLYGFYLGIKELCEGQPKDKRLFLGTILSGVMFIIWIAVLIMGIK